MLLNHFSEMNTPNHALYPNLEAYCESLPSTFDAISPERKIVLEKITHFISRKHHNEELVKLVYICTHNSRRSHFGQVWAKVASIFYGLEGVETFSGGTEATAFHVNAVAALRRCGLALIKTNSRDNLTNGTANPAYLMAFSDEKPPEFVFSKVYDEDTNPQSGFAAIMVCSQADEACPFVTGAETRISLPYTDPKAFDSTPEEAAEYDKTCRLIALETFYCFQQAVKNMPT